MIGSFLLTLLGVLLVSLTLFDVFLTVLHPQVESPFSSFLQRTLWRLLRTLARPLPQKQRNTALGLGVPLLIVALLLSWLLLTGIGFGFIYEGWIATPGAMKQDAAVSYSLWDALYFSGVTLGTIGYGDMTPTAPLLRMVAVLEGLDGVMLVSLSIAYLLGVYPEFQRKTVVAVLLNEETAGQVSGLPLLQRYLARNKFEALAGLLRHLNLELLEMAEAHRRYPVLHYSHPLEVERSFLRVLLVIRNLLAALRYGMAGGKGCEWSEDPRVQDLEDSLFYTLYTLGSSLHLAMIAPHAPLARSAAVSEHFSDLCARLEALGLPTPSRQPRHGGTEPSEYRLALAGYSRFFAVSEAALLSYMRNSGYSPREALEDAPHPEMLVKGLEILDSADADIEEDEAAVVLP